MDITVFQKSLKKNINTKCRYCNVLNELKILIPKFLKLLKNCGRIYMPKKRTENTGNK